MVTGGLFFCGLSLTAIAVSNKEQTVFFRCLSLAVSRMRSAADHCTVSPVNRNSLSTISYVVVYGSVTGSCCAVLSSYYCSLMAHSGYFFRAGRYSFIASFGLTGPR